MGALKVAVIGASGRLGSFACARIEADARFELVGRFASADDWPSGLARGSAQVVLEATRAGLGFEHARSLLELGRRIVVATSGVSPEQAQDLDALARKRRLGGIVVPNFSLGALLLARVAVQLAPHFPGVEIIELHHERKRDAPSATARETARRLEQARPGRPSVPIHSVRLPGLYAHQEVLFGGAGETLCLRHDMSGPQAFGPGLDAALLFAAGATGVAFGLEAALA